VRPALRLLEDLLEHQELGAVQVADDRDVRRDPRRGLVQRRQMVEVQHVDLARARGHQYVAPSVGQVLGDVAAQRGEHPVRRVPPVLVGGVERRVGEQRVGRVERGGEVEGVHVEAGVELARVARAAGPLQ
jgi:hypothetical protein